jgi:hypothetical protein
MKNNLFLKIRIRIVTTIYIEYVLGYVLGNVLCAVLGHVLLAYSSTSPSTQHNRSIISPFHNYKPFQAMHKKEGISNYMGRRTGFNLPSLPGLSAHKGRKRNNEICKNRTIHGHIYRSRIVQV